MSVDHRPDPVRISIEMFKFAVSGDWNLWLVYLIFIGQLAYASYTQSVFMGAVSLGMIFGIILGRVSAFHDTVTANGGFEEDG